MSTLTILGLVGLVWVGAVWTLQRPLLFPRPPAPASPLDLPPGARSFRVGPANVEAVLLEPPGTARAPLVVFTHGNGELIDHWVHSFLEVRDAGVAVLLVEYPGYGRSGGSPSERAIRETMLAAYDRAVAEPRVDVERVIAWGRSLGGGAACLLARERRLAGLVLESSFSSVRALARRLAVPGPLVRDPFDNEAALREVRLPTLVLHGERDQVIPVAHGEALARAAGVPLVRLRCGHNDCPFPWRVVRRFLAEADLLPTL